LDLCVVHRYSLDSFDPRLKPSAPDAITWDGTQPAAEALASATNLEYDVCKLLSLLARLAANVGVEPP
jgi:hypothetical protein